MRSELNFAQGFAVSEFPRGRVEIDITFERLAREPLSRKNKKADQPPKTTHSRISPATQATPWQEISLTLYGDNSFDPGTFTYQGRVT